MSEVTVTGRQGREQIILKSNGEVSLHRRLDGENKWDWIANSDVPLGEGELAAWLSGWNTEDSQMVRTILALQPSDLRKAA